MLSVLVFNSPPPTPKFPEKPPMLLWLHATGESVRGFPGTGASFSLLPCFGHSNPYGPFFWLSLGQALGCYLRLIVAFLVQEMFDRLSLSEL